MFQRKTQIVQRLALALAFALLYMHIGMEAMHGRLHDALEGKTGRSLCALSAVHTHAEHLALQSEAVHSAWWILPEGACPLCELDAVLSLAPAIPVVFACAAILAVISLLLPASVRSPRRAILLASNRGPPAFA